MLEATDELTTARRRIGDTVRTVRTQRGWSQLELARRLGISQPKLSRVESGEGSLSAEQFLLVLRLFNIDLPAFVDVDDHLLGLQNALVRFGATHLRHDPSVPPDPAFRRPRDCVLAVLLEPRSERLVTALSPVLVRSADALSLPNIQHELQLAGVPHRLGWLVENTREAARPLTESPAPDDRRAARRAVVHFDYLLDRVAVPGPEEPLDLFDAAIRSRSGVEEVQELASPISRRWRIASELQVDDFAEALRGALEPI